MVFGAFFVYIKGGALDVASFLGKAVVRTTVSTILARCFWIVVLVRDALPHKGEPVQASFSLLLFQLAKNAVIIITKLTKCGVFDDPSCLILRCRENGVGVTRRPDVRGRICR